MSERFPKSPEISVGYILITNFCALIIIYS